MIIPHLVRRSVMSRRQTQDLVVASEQGNAAVPVARRDGVPSRPSWTVSDAAWPHTPGLGFRAGPGSTVTGQDEDVPNTERVRGPQAVDDASYPSGVASVMVVAWHVHAG